MVSTLGSVTDPRGLAGDRDGNTYTNAGYRIWKLSPAGDGTIIAGSDAGTGYQDGAASAARFDNLRGLTIDENGNLIATTAGDHRIRIIAVGAAPQPILPLPAVPPSQFVAQARLFRKPALRTRRRLPSAFPALHR